MRGFGYVVGVSMGLKLKKFSMYVIYFFVFAVIGWLYELGWEIYLGHGFVNRGFFHGFYLPIYGFGGVALLLCLSNLMSKNICVFKVKITPLIVFVAIVIISSVIEYVAGWGIETFLHTKLWDYSTTPFNLHGRIALKNSLIFGVGGMFFLYFIYPLLKKALGNINYKTVNRVAVIIVLTIVVDLILVLMGY